jgi:hypothetical protein
MSFFFDVELDRLWCEDPESLHSNDKFALAGAVITDLDASGFAMPTMRPPRHQFSNFPSDLVHIFSGVSSVPKVGLVLQAWDLDENEGWTENRDEIRAVSAAIAAVAKKKGGTAGNVIAAIAAAVPEVIDQFVKWDKNDELMNQTQWVDMPTGSPYTPVTTPLAVRFAKEERDLWPGSSKWDYTLHLFVTCTWLPLLGTTLPIEQLSEHPLRNSTLNLWVGGWRGEGGVFRHLSAGKTA